MDYRSSEALSSVLRCFLDLEFSWIQGQIGLSWEAEPDCSATPVRLVPEQHMDLRMDSRMDLQDRV